MIEGNRCGDRCAIGTSHQHSAINFQSPKETNTNGWAYWSGTSFATPIISALAARVLELKQRGGLPADTSVRQTLTGSIATRQTQWTRLEPAHGAADGPMILAVQQCPSTDNDGAGEDSQYTG